jgi:hypothetical protein
LYRPSALEDYIPKFKCIAFLLVYFSLQGEQITHFDKKKRLTFKGRFLGNKIRSKAQNIKI